MKKLRSFTALLIALSVTCWSEVGFAQTSPQPDWPLFQQNVGHTGQTFPSRSVQNPAIRWKQPVGVAGWLNSPLIADGQVFISSSGYLWQIPDYEAGNESDSLLTDGVYAFDLKTGERNWYAPAQADVSGIAFENGLIFATGDEGAVWALDARSGELKWRQNLGSETYQVLVHKQVVYLGNSQGQFFALDAQTGKIRWKTALKGSIRAGAALQGDRLVVGTTQGKIYGLNLKGKIRWEKDLVQFYPEYINDQYTTAIEIYASPTLYKNSAIIGFARDTLYPTPALIRLDLLTGQ
ncbi:MAG: PQQ-binding-like beta-propeller repeat protein [Candidatus Sericytochromatia bacterium]